MEKRELLIKRLEQIGESLKNSGNAVALLSLGSCGLERERMDEYSDLDFFAIVKDGFKNRYIDNVDWLECIQEVGFKFRNSFDGYKLLFTDDVFCEFAVFEQHELTNIPYSKGKVVWKAEGFNEDVCVPNDKFKPVHRDIDKDWVIGEAVTNLYVGLGRYRRGEKLSAFKFVQIYAADRIMDLAPLLEEEQKDFKDIFANDRRFENRYPNLAKEFPKFAQGYDKTIESAKAILEFLDEHFGVNECIKNKINLLL